MLQMEKLNFSHQIYEKLSYQPTNSQKKIIEALGEYLSDADSSRIFILNGYAGTGKTTLVAALVAALKSVGVRSVLLAPTGRAAKVLSQYAGEKALTIHKRIYRERTNAAYESKFSLNINREQNTVFIVDEASMLSSGGDGRSIFGSGSLLDDLVSYVRSGRNCRLILVGDNAQLPPVGEEYSPALEPSELLPYGDVEYQSMNEVVRQEQDSGILYNATLVRCMLENYIYEIPKLSLDFPDVKSLSGSELIETLQECYDRYGRDETIVITRSNKRANRYNEGIRRVNFAAEEELESGDMLMVVKNNYHYTERIENCPMSFIANGDIARLKRLRRYEELYGFRFATATLAFDDYDNTEIECKIMLDTLRSESPALTREESDRLFREVEQDYLDVKSKLKRLQEIRENSYYNALQIKFAYAVTCHKAQGGQWKAVFIDRFLFGDEPMTRDIMRWLYTAMTRATERLYFINFDEQFFE